MKVGILHQGQRALVEQRRARLDALAVAALRAGGGMGAGGMAIAALREIDAEVRRFERAIATPVEAEEQ